MIRGWIEFSVVSQSIQSTTTKEAYVEVYNIL
jgi:hypothetical protein